MNRRTLLIGAGALLSSTALAPFAAFAQAAGTAAPAEAAAAPQITEMTLGAADAPVEVIEYASFTCPHCATFHNNVFEPLKKEYVDTGRVKERQWDPRRGMASLEEGWVSRAAARQRAGRAGRLGGGSGAGCSMRGSTPPVPSWRVGRGCRGQR